MTQIAGNIHAPANAPAGRTPTVRLIAFGGVVVVIGALMAIFGSGWVWAVGLSLLALSVPSLLMGFGLPSPATVQQWMTDEQPV